MTDIRDDELQDVQTFRASAAAWVRENLRRSADAPSHDDEASEIQYQRDLMRTLYEGGYAGICWPREYGGRGLTVDHLQAFTEVARGYELPLSFHLPTMTILGATLLDFGTEEQKRRHIPAILSGEEFWAQFLSDPRGGRPL